MDFQARLASVSFVNCLNYRDEKAAFRVRAKCIRSAISKLHGVRNRWFADEKTELLLPEQDRVDAEQVKQLTSAKSTTATSERKHLRFPLYSYK